MTERKAKRRGIFLTMIFALLHVGLTLWIFLYFEAIRDHNVWRFVDLVTPIVLIASFYRGRYIGKYILIDQGTNLDKIYVFFSVILTIIFFVTLFFWQVYFMGIPVSYILTNLIIWFCFAFFINVMLCIVTTSIYHYILTFKI